MLGLVSLVVLTLMGEISALAIVVPAALFAAFYGLGVWWFLRGRMEVMWHQAARVEGPLRTRPRQPFVLGLLLALLAAVLGTLVAWCMGSVLGEDMLGHLVPGLLLGVCLWVSLEVRDLRCWQESSGLELRTRAGARRFAWTSKQGQEMLVAVVQRRPAPVEAAADTPAEP